MGDIEKTQKTKEPSPRLSMKKENIIFALSLLGFVIFYGLSRNTFPSITKEIYRLAWLFCMCLCFNLYRLRGKEKKEDKEGAEDKEKSGTEEKTRGRFETTEKPSKISR